MMTSFFISDLQLAAAFFLNDFVCVDDDFTPFAIPLNFDFGTVVFCFLGTAILVAVADIIFKLDWLECSLSLIKRPEMLLLSSSVKSVFFTAI